MSLLSTLTNLKTIFLFLIDPWLFMLESLSHLPRTLLTNPFLLLHSPSSFRAAWFGNFWASAGPGVRQTGEARVIPLLQGRVHAGQVLLASDADVATTKVGGEGVSGVVLELGPGTGMWSPLFANLQQPIAKVYGVEPNAAHHAQLRRRVVEAGMGDTYEIVPVGVEELEASGRVQRGSVDCIVSVLCMCSIPEPQRNIAELFGYLKPGGRWFVYEHVRCESWVLRESGLAMRLYQAFLNLFWPKMLNGCDLCRNTPKMLMEAGPWSKVDLAQPEGEPWYHPLPHVLGTLTK